MARGGQLFYAARPVRFLRPLLALSALLAASLAAGCAPQMGDSCDTSANCSINGDRTCDVAQPGGYCTIFDCQANNCPDDAVCVRFNPDPARRAVVACMRRCGGDGDCRQGDGYACRSVEQLRETGLGVELVDTEAQRFCVAVDAE